MLVANVSTVAVTARWVGNVASCTASAGVAGDSPAAIKCAATVLHRRVYDRLLDGLPVEDNIWSWTSYWGSMDAWIQNRFGRSRTVRIWATMPKLVVQHANYSDICGRILTTEESEGSHFEMATIPLDADAFERSLDRSPFEAIHQTLKRTSRVLRARLRGFRKV